MKRNLDLIRHILLVIETNEDEFLTEISFTSEQYNENMVAYHIKLLLDAEYIIANVVEADAGEFVLCIVDRMTNRGHDYLDSVRNDTVWQKTLEKIKGTVGSASLDVIKTVASKIALDFLGL